MQEEKKRTKWLLNKNIFFALNEDELLKHLHELLKHLHAPFKAKKGERRSSNKANSFERQLTANYVQKKKNSFIPYKLKILINGVGANKLQRGREKTEKLASVPSVY